MDDRKVTLPIGTYFRENIDPWNIFSVAKYHSAFLYMEMSSTLYSVGISVRNESPIILSICEKH